MVYLIVLSDPKISGLRPGQLVLNADKLSSKGQKRELTDLGSAYCVLI